MFYYKTTTMTQSSSIWASLSGAGHVAHSSSHMTFRLVSFTRTCFGGKLLHSTHVCLVSLPTQVGDVKSQPCSRPVCSCARWPRFRSSPGLSTPPTRWPTCPVCRSNPTIDSGRVTCRRVPGSSSTIGKAGDGTLDAAHVVRLCAAFN